jgi:hypothetical protein
MRTLVHVLCDLREGDSFLAWKIAAAPYGSEGEEPRDFRECPYFREHGDAVSCVSGSGSSMCGGFMGGTRGYVYCIWRLWDGEADYV